MSRTDPEWLARHRAQAIRCFNSLWHPGEPTEKNKRKKVAYRWLAEQLEESEGEIAFTKMTYSALSKSFKICRNAPRNPDGSLKIQDKDTEK